MNITIENSFVKDAKKLSKEVQADLQTEIFKIENCSDLSQLKFKKMVGFKNAIRVRFGNYRIGIVIENDTLKLTRVGKRGDIYKAFP
ncbi:MAG: type II toxin-antitoxin system RelE/ParE family toxin [Cytophagales bacterium]|nr:MAG: type II toxin-antitoxin system RelE/ParE family toxin [Cytophagales bacterium]